MVKEAVVLDGLSDGITDRCGLISASFSREDLIENHLAGNCPCNLCLNIPKEVGDLFKADPSDTQPDT